MTGSATDYCVAQVPADVDENGNMLLLDSPYFAVQTKKASAVRWTIVEDGLQLNEATHRAEELNLAKGVMES